jgi:serine phosphatase RsbU (regulator of sigma subunit)
MEKGKFRFKILIKIKRFLMKRTTIFNQLILNVVIPAVLALLILGFFNYKQTKNNIVDSNREKNEIISGEIIDIMEFQDLTLKVLEERLNKKMEKYSNELVNHYFSNTNNIEQADLSEIQREIGMNPELEDIYIIDTNGIVVNTTFEKDMGLNFFSFGEEHKNLLLDVFENGEFLSERFAIEAKTKRLKKYTYQPTKDGKYIVELGIYSSEADEIINHIKQTINDLSNVQTSIVDVNLFIGKDNPFSLNKETQLNNDLKETLLKRFEKKDTVSIKWNEGNRHYTSNFYYMKREGSDLYEGSVLQIVSDRTNDLILMRNELLKFLGIFGATILVVIILLYKKTRVITHPIKKLVDNVNRITNGHLNERAEVLGNNEITTLSQKFNTMIEELQSLYSDLEQKVKERTAEVVRQKEEIEVKNKHITDSIKYAQRIQNAILPPDDYISKLLPNSFILYKPKDIVSGDFYWLAQKGDYVMFSAVDCTGHGVPGAFMSIVGYNQLNFAVDVRRARRASKILDYLNEGVTQTLREKNGQDSLNTIRDGMDLALCSYNIKEKKIHYAGAHNPLYIIRDGELYQYKANRFPIGAPEEEVMPEFTNHEIEVQEGDLLYMFSDGYVDQFGGPKGKRFLKKNFKKLLLSIYHKPMDEQHKILEDTLRDWQGDEQQVDDILVMGVKI